MANSKPKLTIKTRAVSEAEAKRRHDVIDAAINRHHGVVDDLEGAIGMYMVGRHVGWKVLFLVHSRVTIARYEAILGVNIREEFDEVGPDADRSVFWNLVSSMNNFWRIVTGSKKVELGRKERRSIV